MTADATADESSEERTTMGVLITDSNIIQPSRGSLEQWVFERCRWCWDRCSDGGECDCDPLLCDDQARMRRDAPLFAKAREYDGQRERLVAALRGFVDYHDERRRYILAGKGEPSRPCSCDLCSPARAVLKKVEASDGG